MDLGIKDRVAVVTGGSRGLGRQAALSLANEGVKIAICGRTSATLDKTVGEISLLGVSAIGIVADITDVDALKRIKDAVGKDLGTIDILVNNAGGRRGGPGFDETSRSEFRENFELNVFGAMDLIRLVLPDMKRNHWGRIINIASIWGREHGGAIGYMSAKSALIGATKHLALELAEHNILVNSIAPGSIKHPGGTWEKFTEENPPQVVDEFIKQNLPLGKFGWPEPIGDTVAFLASEKAGLITGACINVDGGQTRSLI